MSRNPHAANRNWAVSGLALSLLTPSLAVFHKYLGTIGVVTYVVVAILGLISLIKYQSELAHLASKFSVKHVYLLAALTFFTTYVAFAAIYPIADSGVVGGGSDGDDALNIGTTQLLQGHYPYYYETYLRYPVVNLPGALVLAIPFVLLGNSAYQNLLLLPIFFAVMVSYLKDARAALGLLWTILVLSPIVLFLVITGSDHVSNSLYVFLLIFWLITSVSQVNSNQGWQRIFSAILLGIGFSIRANFVLLLPLVFSAMRKNAGWQSAIKHTAITCFAFTLVTLPFFLYDPQGFAPLRTADTLGQFEHLIPWAGIAIPLLTGILAIVLAFFQTSHRNFDVLLRNCAIVLALPVFCSVVLSSIEARAIDLQFASYGVFYVFFGAVAFWPRLIDLSKSQESMPTTPI